MSRKIFRDGKVHVRARQCETCIFKREQAISLRPGRRSQMESEALARGSAIVCHESLGGLQCVCRGFYNRHRRESTPLQLAERLHVLEFD